MGSSVISVGDKSVVLVDCSNKTPQQIEDIQQTLQEAREIISGAPEKSVYVITDLTQSKFNPELVTMFSDFTSANTKAVKVSVLVGLNDHHKVIMTIFKKLHKRDFHLTGTLEEAKKYLMTVQ